MEILRRLQFNELYADNIKITVLDKIENIGMHWHNYYELIFFYNANAISNVNGIDLTLSGGLIYLLTPTDVHNTFSLDKDSKTKYINISFKENAVDRNLISKLNSVFYMHNINSEDDIYKLLELIQTHNTRKCDSDILVHLLNCILINLTNYGTQLISSKSPINEIVSGALTYISTHFDERLTLSYIAKYLHVSPAYFSYLVSKTTGTTFINYLNNYRLNAAKELLKSKEKSITDVCFECGFSSFSNFSRMFKRTFNISPGEYRKNL